MSHDLPSELNNCLMWIFSLASLLTAGSVQEEEEEDDDRAPLWAEEEDTASTPVAEIIMHLLKK